MRRRHGGAEMPTRLASSTLVMRPSSCSSLRILRSMASRRAGTNDAPKADRNGQDHSYREILFRETILRALDIISDPSGKPVGAPGCVSCIAPAEPIHRVVQKC